MNECEEGESRTSHYFHLEQSPGIHEKISRSCYRNGKDLGNALGRQRHELSYQPNAAGRQLSGEDRSDPVYLTHSQVSGTNRRCGRRDDDRSHFDVLLRGVTERLGNDGIFAF